MENNKIICIQIQTCDICGITWEQAYKKYHGSLKSFAGFESTKYKILGWLDICPGCRKHKDSDIFKEIIKLKIDLLRKIKKMINLTNKNTKG